MEFVPPVRRLNLLVGDNPGYMQYVGKRVKFRFLVVHRIICFWLILSYESIVT